ncbi:hypothetical protein C8F04DRAFT_1267466 [Mycena alexandri]|uniref:Uncharacterized protein n=1 Tax=Mycena alexandri TaxID=1745969 RepID=A0AAD6SG67_9AGAR|nr:hypothetical protein C8F04DRAFT_1267466 [Mycena alexandri]
MTRPPLPPDICVEIALLASPQTRAQLLPLCRVVYKMTVPLVYRNISVGDNANQLVRTLATRPELAAVVQSLEFRHSATARIDYPEWTVALRALVNLHKLVTDYHVPLKEDIIALITFRLRSFTSYSTIIGTWANFLATQGELQELVLHSDFMGRPPTPQELPHLRVLKARYDDMAKFSTHSGVQHVWFWLARPTPGIPFGTRNLALLSQWQARPSTVRINGPQVLALLELAPAMLGGVRHLVLDEHRQLSRFTHGSGVLRVAPALDRHRMPQLQVLTMVYSARESIFPNDPPVEVGMVLDAKESLNQVRRGKRPRSASPELDRKGQRQRHNTPPGRTPPSLERVEGTSAELQWQQGIENLFAWAQEPINWVNPPEPELTAEQLAEEAVREAEREGFYQHVLNSVPHYERQDMLRDVCLEEERRARQEQWEMEDYRHNVLEDTHSSWTVLRENRRRPLLLASPLPAPRHNQQQWTTLSSWVFADSEQLVD